MITTHNNRKHNIFYKIYKKHRQKLSYMIIYKYDFAYIINGSFMDWKVEYYKRENRKIPVLEFLLTLNPKMRAKAFNEIELLEKHGNDLKEPYVKSIKGSKYKGLFELIAKF